MSDHELAEDHNSRLIAGRRLSPFGAMLTQFFGFGIAAGLWAGSVPFVANQAKMTTLDIGRAFTLFTAGYIVAMTLGGGAMRLASPRAVMLMALPVNALAMAGLLLSTSTLQVTICLAAVGLIMGLIDLVMNTEGTFVEKDMRRPILVRLHCFASLGTGIGAIAGSAFALTIGLFASVALSTLALTIGFIAIHRATPERMRLSGTKGGLWAAYSPSLMILGIIFGIGAAGETSASIWSARLLSEQAPSLAAISGIGVSFFAGCQVLMRFFGDRLRQTFSDATLVAVSLGFATIGFSVVGMSDGFAASVIGFAFVGLGTALQVPCIFSIAARLNPQNGGSALSLVALIAGLPRLAAPWAFGEVASHTTTGIAFDLIAGAFIIAVCLAIIVRWRFEALATSA